jgi:hypothetical protein
MVAPSPLRFLWFRKLLVQLQWILFMHHHLFHCFHHWNLGSPCVFVLLHHVLSQFSPSIWKCLFTTFPTFVLLIFQFLLQANCCIDSFYNPLSFLTLRWWWWCQQLKSFLMVQYYKIVLQLAFPTPFAIYIALQKLFLHNNLFQLLYGLIHVLQFYVLVFFCYFL